MGQTGKTWPVAVIGAGAAGLAAAISAGRQLKKTGGSVLLLEKLDRVGKKILATGNGRCNLSHDPLTLADYHGQEPAFCLPALSKYDLAGTKDWFNQLGLMLRTDPDGRVFPYSYQATAVLDLLRHALTTLPITLMTNQAAKQLNKSRQGDFYIGTASDTFQASQVILASGGLAAPAFGCTGDGYKLAASCGHQLVQPYPALVQLLADKKAVRPWIGIRVEGTASLWAGARLLRQETGEILFADYGLSGPAILQLSRQLAGRDPSGLELALDFLPQISQDQLLTWLINRCEQQQSLTGEHLLTGLLQKKIGQALLRQASSLPLASPVTNYSKAELIRLAGLVKHWPIKITGSRDWRQAQVTAGGLATAEFCRETMQSKKTAGLYAAGELLDIDGDCGGFNLQWAWSSGRLAGKMAALAWLGQPVQ